ncbi:MAG: prepilin-type N-terminal cleavage/methylation domain-containing protein [Gemmatimonadetes bacterium]|nr:prepilin-type N-terminal cleavage/methylation domain-containing protein [Gemmatimonadota bacterium]
MRSSKLSPARAGFTLVEVMVALVLGALLVGFVLQFVTGQTRIASRQTAREEVQQNARGALEVVASDLRGAIASGLILGEERQIRFMLPRRWGVVCSGNGSTQTTAVFPILPGDAIPVGTGTGLIVLSAGSNTWVPAVPTLATVTARAGASLTDPAGCGPLSPSGQVEAFTFTGANHPAVTRGDRIAVYQLVRYDVGVSQGRNWLRRSSGTGIDDGSMQPLAGPVDSVAFAYLGGTPAVEMAPPGAGAATAGVKMIRFGIKTSSRSSVNGAPVTESGSIAVQIRN